MLANLMPHSSRPDAHCRHAMLLCVLAIAIIAVACSGGNSSSPTSPSGPFSGSWVGTFGSPPVPITITLSQSGSTVSGTMTITSGPGVGQVLVQGTASGSTANVTFTNSDGSAVGVTNATFTLNGGTMSTQWIGTGGIVITGTLTGGATPVAAPTAPSSGTKYDGTYNFFFKYPCPTGTCSNNLPNFLIIRNGNVTASDGSISGGSVSSFGNITFTSACPINSSVATWTGVMNASALAGANFGQGTYTCSFAIGGGSNDSWQATQSK
jgi:hypothetical protein